MVVGAWDPMWAPQIQCIADESLVKEHRRMTGRQTPLCAVTGLFVGSLHPKTESPYLHSDCATTMKLDLNFPNSSLLIGHGHSNPAALQLA